MQNYIFAWTCANCGHVHSGVASDTDPEFSDKRNRFIADCISKGEPYEIIPTSLTENAELIEKRSLEEDTHGNFIQSLLMALTDGDEDTAVFGLPVDLPSDPSLN